MVSSLPVTVAKPLTETAWGGRVSFCSKLGRTKSICRSPGGVSMAGDFTGYGSGSREESELEMLHLKASHPPPDSAIS